jgi:hypothetical protein
MPSGPTPQNNKRTGWAALLLAVLVALVIAVTLRNADRSLRDRSTTIGSVRNWLPPNFSPVHDPMYEWLSDHQAVTWQMTPKGTFRAVVADVRTGTTKPLPDFDSPDAAEVEPSYIKLCPDGRRLLWQGGQGTNRTWLAGRVDKAGPLTRYPLAKKYIGLPQGVFPEHWAWMPDCRGWVHFPLDYNGRTSKLVMYLETGHDRRISKREVLIKGLGVDVYWPRIIGLTGDGRLVVHYLADGLLSQMAYFTAKLKLDGVQFRRFAILKPAHGSVHALAISRKANRLAWLIASERDPPRFARLIHNLVPSFKADRREVVELWISRLDGSNARRIGYQPINVLKDDEYPSGLRWMPDGKRVSFVLRNVLQTVPVD